MTVHREQTEVLSSPVSPLSERPCRVLLVPGSGTVLPASLKEADIVVDVAFELSGTEAETLDAFGELVVANQGRTVLVTASPVSIKTLLGSVTGAEPEHFAVTSGSFSFVEVAEDGRGVLHLLNWNSDSPSVEPAPAPNVCRIYLLRHGQSMVVEAGGQVWSHHPIGLTPLGHVQARHAGEALRTVSLAAVYTSDLTRAAETAAHVSAAHGLNPIIDPALREIKLGEFEGLTLEGVRERGDARFLPWLEVTFNEEFPHERFHHPADLAFPGGESILAVHERSLDAFGCLVDRHLGEVIAVVSHTWVIQPLIAHIVVADPRAYYRFSLRYATQTVVDVHRDGTGTLRKLNADLALDEVAGGRLSPKEEG